MAAKPTDTPTPTVNDPGGAHAKGYGADPTPGQAAPATDPVPLADDADVKGHVHPPKEGQPTGRSEAEGAEKGRILGGGA